MHQLHFGSIDHEMVAMGSQPARDEWPLLPCSRGSHQRKSYTTLAENTYEVDLYFPRFQEEWYNWPWFTEATRTAMCTLSRGVHKQRIANGACAKNYFCQAHKATLYSTKERTNNPGPRVGYTKRSACRPTPYSSHIVLQFRCGIYDSWNAQHISRSPVSTTRLDTLLEKAEDREGERVRGTWTFGAISIEACIPIVQRSLLVIHGL